VAETTKPVVVATENKPNEPIKLENTKERAAEKPADMTKRSAEPQPKETIRKETSTTDSSVGKQDINKPSQANDPSPGQASLPLEANAPNQTTTQSSKPENDAVPKEKPKASAEK
jgi:hypothetical protein